MSAARTAASASISKVRHAAARNPAGHAIAVGGDDELCSSSDEAGESLVFSTDVILAFLSRKSMRDGILSKESVVG
jgi:hypothetical protein